MEQKWQFAKPLSKERDDYLAAYHENLASFKKFKDSGIYKKWMTTGNFHELRFQA